MSSHWLQSVIDRTKNNVSSPSIDQEPLLPSVERQPPPHHVKNHSISDVASLTKKDKPFNKNQKPIVEIKNSNPSVSRLPSKSVKTVIENMPVALLPKILYGYGYGFNSEQCREKGMNKIELYVEGCCHVNGTETKRKPTPYELSHSDILTMCNDGYLVPEMIAIGCSTCLDADELKTILKFKPRHGVSIIALDYIECLRIAAEWEVQDKRPMYSVISADQQLTNPATVVKNILQQNNRVNYVMYLFSSDIEMPIVNYFSGFGQDYTFVSQNLSHIAPVITVKPESSILSESGNTPIDSVLHHENLDIPSSDTTIEDEAAAHSQLDNDQDKTTSNQYSDNNIVLQCQKLDLSKSLDNEQNEEEQVSEHADDGDDSSASSDYDRYTSMIQLSLWGMQPDIKVLVCLFASLYPYLNKNPIIQKGEKDYYTLEGFDPNPDIQCGTLGLLMRFSEYSPENVANCINLGFKLAANGREEYFAKTEGGSVVIVPSCLSV